VSLHLGLIGSTIRADARAAGARTDWTKLAAKREFFGRRLQTLLIEKNVPTPEELVRQTRVAELANRFPVLDTRRPDCPPFLVRGRLRGESGACDVLLHHRGDNDLDLVVVTVNEGLPYLACIDRRGFALDPVRPEVVLLDSPKMQWTMGAGERGKVSFNFSFNTTADFEQFASLDIRSLVSSGGESLADAGSTADVIRLVNTTSNGNRTEIEYRPNLREPSCYIRLASQDVRATEIEITLNPIAAAPLARVPGRGQIEQIVPVREVPAEVTAIEATELLGFFWRCVYSNRAPFDSEARAAYAKIDRNSPDWAALQANQRRVGTKLRELMSIQKRKPTPDDTPISPQLAADSKEEVR
jgi:hypothetical protein